MVAAMVNADQPAGCSGWASFSRGDYVPACGGQLAVAVAGRSGGEGMTEQENRPAQLRTARLEAFSDGVFAVAITLLVLEIAIPAGSEDDLLGAVLDQWPSYLAYVVSFATVGAIWLAHTAVTDYLHHADTVLMRLNLLLLMMVSFLPFPTKLLAESVEHEEAGKIAATFYGLSLLAASVVMAGLWRYAVRHHLVRPEAGDDDVNVLSKKLTPGLAFYLVMLGLGLFLPVVAVFGYLAIAVFYLIPIHWLRGRR